MRNPIKEISKWQHDSGNADLPYDDFLQGSFQIEEAIEGIELPCNGTTIDSGSPKEISRQIMTWVLSDPNRVGVTDVDRLDKACDAIVYAIGSMTQLKLDHHDITKALNIVNQANMQKLNMPRDDKGKLMKPEGFVGPEPELQKILDKRKNK